MRTAALYVSGAIAALGVTLALRSEPRDLSRVGTSVPCAAQKEIESVEKEINRIEDVACSTSVARSEYGG